VAKRNEIVEKRKRVVRDLTGKNFGKLTVIENTYKQNKHNCYLWKCLCECGNIIEVPTNYLTSGNTKSCGCGAGKGKTGRKYKDISNQRFGILTAIHPTDARSNSGSVIWECLCDCGNTVEVRSSDLVSGYIRSCGCLKAKAKDLTGQRFGRLTVIRPVKEQESKRSIIWECTCDCGNTVFLPSKRLRSGNVKSCGCYRRDVVRQESHKAKRYKDLTGQTFGRFTVLGKTDKRSYGNIVWKCQKDTGEIILRSTSVLKREKKHFDKIKDHLPKKGRAFKDMTGQRYGRLTAIEFVERKNGATYWKCRCDCGNEVIKNIANLKSGKTVSCGCIYMATRNLRSKAPKNTLVMSSPKKIKNKKLTIKPKIS